MKQLRKNNKGAARILAAPLNLYPILIYINSEVFTDNYNLRTDDAAV